MPSGTSTMPERRQLARRASSIAAPRRISSSAVSGLATGMRMRAGSGAGAHRPADSGRDGLFQRVDEVGLEQLELAGLALDALLGLLGRHAAGSR